MIYFYAILLIADILHGVIAFIAGDYEYLQLHGVIAFIAINEIVGFLILITLETGEEE